MKSLDILLIMLYSTRYGDSTRHAPHLSFVCGIMTLEFQLDICLRKLGTENPRVTGSSPVGGINLIKTLS